MSKTLMTEAVTELVAIGAAMASNCEPCFRAHYDRARRLEVSLEDMQRAVDVALAVKAAPHRKVVETAQRCLASQRAPETNGCAEGSSCSCG